MCDQTHQSDTDTLELLTGLAILGLKTVFVNPEKIPLLKQTKDSEKSKFGLHLGYSHRKSYSIKTTGLYWPSERALHVSFCIDKATLLRGGHGGRSVDYTLTGWV